MLRVIVKKTAHSRPTQQQICGGIIWPPREINKYINPTIGQLKTSNEGSTPNPTGNSNTDNTGAWIHSKYYADECAIISVRKTQPWASGDEEIILHNTLSHWVTGSDVTLQRNARRSLVASDEVSVSQIRNFVAIPWQRAHAQSQQPEEGDDIQQDAAAELRTRMSGRKSEHHDQLWSQPISQSSASLFISVRRHWAFLAVVILWWRTPHACREKCSRARVSVSRYYGVIQITAQLSLWKTAAVISSRPIHIIRRRCMQQTHFNRVRCIKPKAKIKINTSFPIASP